MQKKAPKQKFGLGIVGEERNKKWIISIECTQSKTLLNKGYDTNGSKTRRANRRVQSRED